MENENKNETVETKTEAEKPDLMKEVKAEFLGEDGKFDGSDIGRIAGDALGSFKDDVESIKNTFSKKD